MGKNVLVSIGPTRLCLSYARWALLNLPDIMSVLDIGAGDGLVATVLPPQCLYDGVDIGADIYSRTEKVVYVENLDELRTKVRHANSPDLVTIFDVLEHTYDFVGLFKDSLVVSGRYVFVTLPNELSLYNRLGFLLGKVIPAHGLQLINAKPGHRHLWIVDIPNARKILVEEAQKMHFTKTQEIFFTVLPSTLWKRLIVPFFILALGNELLSHGWGVVFEKNGGSSQIEG